MSETVLAVKGLGKCYKSYRNNLTRFASWFGFSVPYSHEFWAIRDVEFSLSRGEAIGVVGRNGAGKSTLLKLITGTVRQSTGSIEMRGSISSILELGLGLNPEYTGVQNIYSAGGMMGFSTERISELLPEIHEFSELGDFINQPIRVYSSGMQARLAFSLATASRPDLLIIDEVLAVGDVSFRRKCYSRIERFLSLGTSLLFVSHDVETVKKLCSSAIYIDKGKIAASGSAKWVCDEYEKDIFSSHASKIEELIVSSQKDIGSNVLDLSILPKDSVTYGNGRAEISDSWIENAAGEKVNVLSVGESFRWCYQVRFLADIAQPIYGMRLKTVEGVDVYSTNTEMLNSGLTKRLKWEKETVCFSLKANLAPNVYFLNAGVGEISMEGETAYLCRRNDVFAIRVVSNSKALFGGIANLGGDVHFGNNGL